MKIRGAIFDLDGTLVESLYDLADSVNAMLERFGFPTHPDDAFKYFIGDGIINLIKFSLPKDRSGDDEFVRSCLDIVNDEYLRRWNVKTRPYDGIHQMLRDLSERDVHLAVLSNKPHEFTSIMVPHFFPDINFEMILGARDDLPRKPDPTSVNLIMKKMELLPEECLYIGDSNIDMRTGKNGGIYTVGVIWGFRPEKELIDAGADLIVCDPQEIVNLVN
jgi:phosphoglycolate phosphatase